MVTVVAPLALALLMGCGGGLGGYLISNEQEVQMGQGVDQEIRKEYKLAAPDDPITTWASGLVQPLVAGSAGFRDPNQFGGFKVHVILDDELVNAFAAPGGYTYISTGLILQAANCGEIAGVMGHELAHVTQRHGVKAIEGAYAVSIISGWFLGDGLASDAAQTIYAFLSNTQFSQEHEAEADAVGYQIAFNGGYNPYGLVDFFSKLLALSGGSAPPQFLSSHPATQDRINDVTKAIEARYGDTVNPGTTQTYECVQTNMTLAQAQARISGGQVVQDPNSGLGTTEAAPQ
ncbi:MAG: M48 family metalloprotease [Deltaproteobacteria bacterium]|nr:M48 family metalloprotease [Deltaproteobacteria bacterium]